MKSGDGAHGSARVTLCETDGVIPAPDRLSITHYTGFHGSSAAVFSALLDRPRLSQRSRSYWKAALRVRTVRLPITTANAIMPATRRLDGPTPVALSSASRPTMTVGDGYSD